MPLNKFIHTINHQLEGLVPGIKLFGIAQSVNRTTGSEAQLLPGIVDKTGEIEYVGIDDVYSVMVYHKQNRISIARSARQGFGDAGSDIVNAYQLSMIVFLDRQKVNLMPDELLLYLQANMPERIEGIDPYKQVLVRLNTVTLNSEQVFNEEYRGTQFKLSAEKSLIRIDYTIESTFKQNCFEKCPEGLTC